MSPELEEEDYEFSMGADLVFVALSGVMDIPRHIDRFNVGRSSM